MNHPHFLLFVVLILLGLFFIFHGIKYIRKGNAIQNWRRTVGYVTSVRIELETTSEGSSCFKPVVEYTYVVDGKEFNHNRRCLVENSYASRKTAENILSRYPVREEVPVYVDPTNPKECLLEKSLSIVSICLTLGFGSLLLFLGLKGLFP